MSSVDVIVPCYNYARYLRECVSSILAQEGVEVRVLIIDDASTDDTPDVAGRLADDDTRVSYRRHEQNLRHIATYNEGIAWVSAKYYLLLSADDYLLPGALCRAVEVMDRDESIGFCHGAADDLLPDGRFERPSAEWVATRSAQSVSMSGRAFIDLCRKRGCINIVSTPTVVVRTALQKRTEGYRPDLPHSGDMELWLRLAAHAGVGYVCTPQAVYRRHTSNMSLAYNGANALEDLRQRERAVEWLIRSCGHLFDEPAGMRQALLVPLGIQAINRASACLNEDRSDMERQFVAFAKRVHPKVVRSSAWLRLVAKKLIGRRASRLLLSARASLQRAAREGSM